ncbi:MAG: hypothetical protein AMXMBFR23_27280 [Chloroflexota bacterium]
MPVLTARRLLLTGVAALALLAGACSEAAPEDASPAAAEATAAATATGEATDTPTATPEPEVTYDPTLVLDDVDCTPEALAIADETYTEAFVTAHYVVGDVLGAVCHGEENPRLLEAWEMLRAFVPAEEFDTLVLFAGFEHLGDDSDPLGNIIAYVNSTADPLRTRFQISINLAVEEDADPRRLTLAHEFSHIFTQEDDQLDRTMDPFACPTYYNGEGCFEADAYIAEWIAAFWDPADIEAIDPWAEDVDGAFARCDTDGGFLGPYAATSPEEDFAEAFSAFVFDLEVETPGLEARYAFFEERPALRAFRDAARAAALTPIDNTFEGCG